jgi:hypothetical protein
MFTDVRILPCLWTARLNASGMCQNFSAVVAHIRHSRHVTTLYQLQTFFSFQYGIEEAVNITYLKVASPNLAVGVLSL